MRNHIDTLGLLFILYGVLQLLGAAALAVLLGGGGIALGIAGGSTGDSEMLIVGGVYSAIGLAVAALIALFAIPEILVGSGIRRRRKWARIGGMIMGGLALSNMPLGTALGVFAFVCLLDAEVAKEFEVADP